MIKRTLQEINNEIQSHREAIKLLEKEIKDFQAACLLCGHGTFKTEDVPVGRYS
jgi:hypothetical protein